jgi:PTS system fructose-specific IIC component
LLKRNRTSHPAGGKQASGGKERVGGAYRHLLTGVSYMLPMVVAGGLCIALSFAFGIKAFEVKDTLAAALMQIGGGSAFALMVPVLAGFIAFSIADRPGLTPGLIGGMLAVSGGSGFIGGIIAGFLAGYVGESHQHEAEAAAEYGSAETDPDHSAGLQPDRRPGDDLPDR